MANRSRKPEQRAYTMRLQNLDPDDSSWRTRLWETHVAVNRGAKVFGDWLLTLKGGLPHTLVDEPVATGMGKRKTERDPTPEDRKNRRVLLALSWLSVESKEGAPTEYLVGDQKKGKSSKADLEETVAELTDILKSRGLSDDQVEIWIKDCEASLTAAKRKDGVWVNRSKAFDHLARQAGVTRNDAVNVILHHFFGPINEYFELSIQGVEDEEKYRAKPDKLNYVQKAVNWISENWGTGLKSDKGSIGGNLKCILSLDFNCFIGRPKTEILSHIGKALGRHNVQSVSDIAALIGWKTGRHSAGRIALDNLPDEPAEQDLERLRDRMQGEADTKTAKGATRAKTPPAWINQLKDDVCNQSAIPFVCGRNLTFEFSVMLDHAARRVSAHHTWVKTAEAERIAFEQDNSKIRNVPDKARAWLDQYCEQRSIETGAVVPYRIRRRAIQGWPAVCEAWSSSQCRTEPDRIAEVRSLQEDPEVKGKTGDVQLFEALAAPDAVCAWKEEGKVCTDILSDYVAAKEAEFKRQHFKVPMYRHPDALHHPVFCDFGKSRWSIKFDTHEAHKDLTAKKRKANKGPETLRGLTMNLWDGKAISPTRLRWQGKRFSRDLKSAQWPPAPHNARPVSREDRLARAAGGLRRDECAGVLGIFQEKDWNGRLQAPRDQLAKLAHYVGLHGWNAKAVAMRDTLRWILSFSARLVPQGPWYGFRKDSETLLKELGWPYNKTNEKRGTQAKLLLCRIPGLRVLSVDLGHRFAAACAVWQTVTAEELSDACLQAGLLVDDLDQAMHLRLTLPERKGGAIYRRIGPPKLPDGRPHPAPWARLDRQFLIKLQGEDQEARRATDEESERVSTWMLELGLDESERLPRNVDELMTRAMDILRLGLQRHRRRAKIAFNLTAKKKLLPGGGSAEPRGKERVDHLTDALLEWHELQDGRRWTDEWAKALWDKQIVPLIAQQKLASFRE
ncbi:MAG: type V CRISPR-associated protein Cas12b, partial [Thermodesulfobacteriota bacterium]